MLQHDSALSAVLRSHLHSKGAQLRRKGMCSTDGGEVGCGGESGWGNSVRPLLQRKHSLWSTIS